MADLRAFSEDARRKAISVFNYIAELARLRARTVRDIASYEDVFWFESVPDDKDCHSIALGRREDDADDTWLSIRKRDEPRCPQPPHECHDWIDEKSLFDSAGHPTLREQIPITTNPASETENLVDEFTRPLGYRRLADNPTVEARFEKYVSNQWKAWAKAHQEWQELQSCYSELFKIHQRLQRLGEQFELVLGLGFLTWRIPNGEKIRRHVFVADAALDFDASNGTFHVRNGAGGSKLRLETDMLLPAERPTGAEQDKIEQSIKGITDDPWERSTLFAALRGWAQSLQDKGEFSDTLGPQDEASARPQINFAPALVLRRRTSHSLLTALDKIIKQLQDGTSVIPPEIMRIVTDPDEFGRTVKDFDDSDAPESQRVSNTVLFPLPANHEQLRIVRELNRKRGVLVQGPPGTGKSHTIANLICHLLATGKRVLVTAQTPRALKVLQNKLPLEIAPLCVSVLGNDIGAMRNLERCIAEINNRYSQWDAPSNQQSIAVLESRLSKLKEWLALLEVSLMEVRESETLIHDVIDKTYHGTAQKIAERLLAEEVEFNWLRDKIAVNAQIPFDDPTFSLLRTSLIQIDAKRIAELKREFPSPASLFTIDQFVSLAREERAALDSLVELGDHNNATEYRVLIGSNAEAIQRFAASLQELLVAIENTRRRPLGWIPLAIHGILTDHDSPWKSLQIATLRLIKGLHERAARLDRHTIRVPESIASDELYASASDLHAHLSSGGGWGWWIFKPAVVKRTRRTLDHVHVDGRGCNSLSQLHLLIESLEVQRTLDQLWELWSSKIEKQDVARIIQVSELVEQLEALTAVISIEKVLESAKAACRKVNGLAEPRWHDRVQIERLLIICGSVTAARRLQDVKARFDKQIHGLHAIVARANAHELVITLANAIESREIESYGRCINQIIKAKADIDLVKRRKEWLSRLRSVAPILEQDLRESPSDPEWDVRLPKIEAGWNWSRAKSWLSEHLQKGKEENLESQISQTHADIADTTASLAAAKAWHYFFERLTERQRQYLSAWQQAIKRVGKGTGRHAARHRRDAQENLDKCRDSIPAWIMPVFRVFETVIPSPEMFDVVIIDEASQCGPDALALLYFAKRAIIVGDDQQISPEAVGINQDDVEVVARQHLLEIDHKDSFGVTSSLFDHGVIRYGNRIVLREHFRCMPEIIRFSNDLCYSDTPLIPLRQYPPQRLRPIVTHYVRSGYREGNSNQVVNRPEAEALANAIVACCRDPKYAEKSMGVISLQGEAQAHLIETMLLEELDTREIEERRIICGDAYSFQGDERDVMFLSLVAAPNHRIGILTREADKRRFNVAASRARDQMWLFHSVQLADLSQSCFRRELLKYCLNPVSRRITVEGLNVDDVERRARAANRIREAPPKPFESWFEVDVFLKLVTRGYRVVPQYEVAGYRIDLVVEGTSSRLAVEVDGDEWHGTENYQSDLDRQRRLERCGWKFWRVRGSEFYCDPEKSLEGLWEEIEARRIEVASDRFGPTEIDGYVPDVNWNCAAEPDTFTNLDVTPQIASPPTETQERTNLTPLHASVPIAEPAIKETACKSEDDTSPHPDALPTTVDSQSPSPSIENAQRPDGKANDLGLRVMLIQPEIWFKAASWAREKNFLSGRDRRMLFSVGRIAAQGGPVSNRQAKYALDLFDKCTNAGFNDDNEHLS